MLSPSLSGLCGYGGSPVGTDTISRLVLLPSLGLVLVLRVNTGSGVLDGVVGADLGVLGGGAGPDVFSS